MKEDGWLVVVVDSLPGEGTLIDLFDQEGIYVGHFKADIPSENLFFEDGRAYVVDEKDNYKFARRYCRRRKVLTQKFGLFKRYFNTNFRR